MTEVDWPNNGCDFNLWYCDLTKFLDLIRSTKNKGFWVADMPLKYLDFRVDTRNGNFILYIRDNGKTEKISPNRGVAAIEKWNDISKPRKEE